MAQDKYVIDCWLKLYNLLEEATYKVIDWPDKDSSKHAIDAVCRDDSGTVLGIEHTLIEPFEGEKRDGVRFLKTLASLGGRPDLLQSGFMIEISQPVGAIQKGVDWSRVQSEQASQLKQVLGTLPEGHHTVLLKGAKWSFEVGVSKTRLDPNDPGKLFVGRIWPGDPGPALIIKALEEKAPKLGQFTGGKRILLLEKDAVAGTIESQFRQLPDDAQVLELLKKVNEVWSVKTAGLESENVIFTNQVWPNIGAFTGSLNLKSGDFWKKETSDLTIDEKAPHLC